MQVDDATAVAAGYEALALEQRGGQDLDWQLTRWKKVSDLQAFCGNLTGYLPLAKLERSFLRQNGLNQFAFELLKTEHVTHLQESFLYGENKLNEDQRTL